MAPKGRAEGAGCVFPWKTRRGERTGRDEQKNSKKIGKNERCDATDLYVLYLLYFFDIF